MNFSDKTDNVFRKSRGLGRVYTAFLNSEKEVRITIRKTVRTRIAVFKSAVLNGGYFCSRENVEKAESKIQSLMRDKCIKKRFIVPKQFNHGSIERSSYIII